MTATKPKPEESVFRHLPLMYRKAGREGEPAWAMLSALGKSFGEYERATRSLMQSRFLEHLPDMDDLQRLAALFRLAPWPEEDLDEFRHRVRLMTGLYLQGAATAKRVLKVLAAATDAELDEASFQGPDPDFGSGDARFTTTATLRRRADPDADFEAKVVDVPPVRHEVIIDHPAPDFEWQVENSAYAMPGGIDEDGNLIPHTYPDPVVDITAPSTHPVVAPVLVQRDLRRLVLINRFIPPGATLRVDLVNHTITDIAGPATLEGPVRYKTETPALLYGTGGLLEDGPAGRLSGTATGGTAAPPFHVIRWHKQWFRGPNMSAVPGEPGNDRHVPTAHIPWPELLPMGSSRWRLMLTTGPGGLIPALETVLPHWQVWTRPATAEHGPERIEFRWTGRRLATFTVVFDEQHLCDGPAPAGPLKHRKDWLVEQIERLKLAGVLYLDQHETELGVAPAAVPEADLSLHLWEVTQLQAKPTAATTPVTRSAGYAEELVPQDSLSVSVTKPEEE